MRDRDFIFGIKPFQMTPRSIIPCDLDRDLYAKNGQFWTLLPRAFVFHKHTCFILFMLLSLNIEFEECNWQFNCIDTRELEKPINVLIFRLYEGRVGRQNRKSTEGYSRWNVSKRQSSRKLFSTIWAQASPKNGVGNQVSGSVKRSLFVCHTRCKCSDVWQMSRLVSRS